MFTSTLRNAMFALSLIAIIAVATPAANACDGTKTDRPAKMVRPLSSLMQGIKRLFSGSGKSTKNEPATDNADYVTDDASELIIGG